MRGLAAGAEKDRERLDWLHEHLKSGGNVYVNGDDASALYDSVMEPLGPEEPQPYHLREAIDAAREQK